MDRTLPAAYEDRPQAYIKHRLLESYLQSLFLIVGTREQELCYVDCFAGPWGDPSDAMSATSIAISLSMLQGCLEKLGARGRAPAVRALYVENDRAAFARLSTYLKTHTPVGVRAECMRGDFVDLKPKILEWVGERAFAFFFIDPKGWKDIGVPTLKQLLARQRSEFLINFMYDHINRTMSMAEWQLEMRELLGSSIDLEHLSPEEREHGILSAYRSSCKQCIPNVAPFRPRSAYARVLDPLKSRPKYHLVYFTSHPLGVIKFMEISQSVDFIQSKVRAELQRERRESKSGVRDLFGSEGQTVNNDGRATAHDVDTFWRSHLIAVGGTRRIGREEFADILESTDWFPNDLQASLVRLLDAGEISNLDAPRRRPKKPLHVDADFGMGERLQMKGYS